VVEARRSGAAMTLPLHLRYLAPRKKKAPKYRNVKTDGYASKREAKRASDLKLLQRAGEIIDLQEQVKFVLVPKQKGMRSMSYYADFVYTDKAGVRHVEDVKGVKTPVYIAKKKLMQQVHGILIEEV
jgi:hypothetical protein